MSRGSGLFITGATGFVGSHVARLAVAAGHDVHALVRETSDTRGLEMLGVSLHRGDITDPASIERGLASCRAVIHVAGVVKARDAAGFTRVNAVGAAVVATAAAAARVERLVHVSSLAARGPDGEPGPVSRYGSSKLDGEAEVRAAVGSATDLQIVRPTAVYGPGDRELLPLFRSARRGLRLALGGGGQLSMVHVDDLARGLVGLVDAEIPPHQSFEVSDGRMYRWRELSAAIGDAVGRPGRVVEIPAWLVAAAAWGSDLAQLATGVPQVFGRDKLGEIRGSWSARTAPFWDTVGACRHDFASGARLTADAYTAAGWL